MNPFRRLTLPRQSGWKLAVIFGFSALLVLALLLARAHTASATSGATITSDKQDYPPGATVTLTGAGWASGEAVHIFVNDSVGSTWSLSSNPDPVADGGGGFTYSFSLPSNFIANYTATATGATSGTATTTFTDSNCPSLSGKVASTLVGASSTTSVNTLTYTFSSVSETQTSPGVPGLIDYCVYPTGSSPLLPNSDTVQATGANGSAWVYDTGTGNFSFHRPNGGGNADNIRLDGITITMGTATWSGSVPTGQKVLLHINDDMECAKLYPNGTGTGDSTCFVLPGLQAKDLTVTKSATPSFTRTFTWGIQKSVDNTKVTSSSGSATFNYTVTVTHDSGTDSGWQVTGTITVSNPNNFEDIVANVSDAIDNGGSCAVSGGTNVTVPAGKSVTLDYSCTYASAPSPSSGTNIATASWDKAVAFTPDGSATGKASVDFSTTTPTVVDGTVKVVDDKTNPANPVTLGTVSYTQTSPKDFTYALQLSGVGGTCTNYKNTATFTTNTTKTTGSASQTVTLCVAEDLQVAKDATPSFTRTYNWSISKTVDKTLVEQLGGGTATLSYTVKVSETGFTDSNWQVMGTIIVSNPNDFESITLTGVTDAVDNSGTCKITGGNTTAAIPAGGIAALSYTCSYPSQPAYNTTVTNTATASWDQSAASTPSGSATGSATFKFTAPTTTVNKTVTITDTFNGVKTTLGTLMATDSTPFTSQTFTYSRTVNVPTSNCVTYPNTATIVETGQTASASVEVCGPAKTGALTMGYWQNKNGQGIITNQAKTGPCPSAAWLTQYAPFQDLSSTATCSQVAAYVTTVIKAATCGGSTCNAMLKAQMLATALDVYFSDPALGGNQIGAPAPVGGVKIDLTKICQMSDGSGTGTCSGTSENVSSAFGGASSLTVSQMLSYAASQSNAGGSTWYGNVKATQVLAKDAFDAINNQVAFAP